MTKLDPINELKEDHKKVRDLLLGMISALQRRDVQKTLELLIELDKLGGPHFRFEEESFYPALEKFFGKEYFKYLIGVHDRVINAAKQIAEVLGKGSITEEANGLIGIIRSEILPHPIECEGLTLLAERLQSSELEVIAKNIEESRRAGVPLLEWADTIRAKGA